MSHLRARLLSSRTVVAGLALALVVGLVLAPSPPAGADPDVVAAPAEVAYGNDEATQIVAGGYRYVCGIRPSGQVACWGQHGEVGKNRPAFESFTQITLEDAVLDAAGCGLRTDGGLRCWHTGAEGLTEPIAGTFTDVSRGSFVCAVRVNGRLACAGDDVPAPPSGSYTDVEVGGLGACALRANGAARCWVQYGGSAPELVDDTPSGAFTDLAVGGAHACGLRDSGQVACWGDADAVVLSPPATTFSSIDAHGGYSCGVRASDGNVLCWGHRVAGPLPGGGYVEVSAGSDRACALRADGTFACTEVLGARGPAVPTGPLWFTDVPTSSPFFGDIAWLADNGLTGGYPDGTFGATGAMSRQAMAAFLWRLEGEPAVPDSAPSFTDVPPSHPYYDAIRWMNHAEVGSGYPDGTFLPSGQVSRQALASFLWRLAGEPVAPSGGFSDVGADHPFAEAIGWLADAGISTGYDGGTFRPGGDVSRQAMAAFVHRFHDGA
jgi:hypothetical protein